MSNTYSMWLGCQVVLHIETRESRVSLRGLVVNESSDILRFRIDGLWDVDIFKEMIVGVEADKYGPLQADGTAYAREGVPHPFAFDSRKVGPFFA
jgi:hypothetical protein